MTALLFTILIPLFLPSSSVSLSYFIDAVPIRQCLGKHSCVSSTFHIAILNGTCFFSGSATAIVHKENSVRDGRNTDALVNMYH